jgi:hypothetical protein
MTITQYKKAIAKLLKAYRKKKYDVFGKERPILKKEREKNEYNAR